MLKQRIITALILLPIFVWALLFMPASGFSVLIAVFVAVGAWEWGGLMQLRQPSVRLMYCAGMLLGLGVIGYFVAKQPSLLKLILEIAAAWWLLAFVMVLRYPASGAWWQARWVKAISGLLVLLPCWTALVYLKVHGSSNGFWLLLLFVLIWSADTGAYFSGRKFGRNKLAPLVSPGKSWEGVVGGAITAALAVLLTLYFNKHEVLGASQYFPLSFLVIITVALSVLGDLFESMAKRAVGVKDSGQLLPGHGGVLDRIDSVTAAAPIFALGLILISGQSEFPRM